MIKNVIKPEIFNSEKYAQILEKLGLEPEKLNELYDRPATMLDIEILSRKIDDIGTKINVFIFIAAASGLTYLVYELFFK